MRKYHHFLEEGRLFGREAEVVAGRFIAEALGLEVGTQLPLFGSRYEVVGIFNSDIAWENGGLLMHADLLGRQLGRADNYSLLFVYSQAEERKAVRERIEREFPHMIAVLTAELTNRFACQR